ncbi:GntR family transcriptional regulator [Planosporangium thailandense]|uniref:GntR family transcriptional regulator n=1 Tax=Planosporangium thailandense TaxID=765197 RepID=A0ABX0Y2Q9_9ACTN|nr:GntR family transcriptional regulator [Planosporangium thailandense]NJC72662.1 GntR family transcriptional regulator [Planosporangium thailandense]
MAEPTADSNTGRRGPARYRVIAAELAGKIRRGEYRPGEALPAQRDLSAQYGVTLMTLRQALQSLQDEGLVVQQAGRGTFVTPTHAAYRVDTLRSLADDLREQGHDVATEVLSRALRRPPSWVGQRLSVDGDDGRVLRLERLRLLGGHPAVHQVSWVRQPYAEAVQHRDFSEVSLYAALADAGVSIVRASETIRPDTLSASSAAWLRQPAGTAIFVSERTTFAVDGTALVVDRAEILGNAMEIRTERAATRLSVSWGPARG